MKRFFLPAMVCLLSMGSLWAQSSNTQNSILWKVTGKGLKKPSYLFGTYHFLTNAFTDTLPAVIKAYKAADAVAGELVMDGSLQGILMEAAMLKGTTLKKVLPDTVYAKAEAWFKQEAGVELTKLDQFNPITVMTFAMAITQQKYFPNKPGTVQLDTYFQEEGKKDGKKVLGLETVDVQINALFKQLSIQRQAELLNETFEEKDGVQRMISLMNKAYISQDLATLQQLMLDSNYKPEEWKVLLEDRNNHWMQELPKLMDEQSLFVAVGAMHLAGKVGLVNQLREQGYSVTPENLKQQ